MKKTFNINLAGFPFIIDEDAYNMLKDYLDTIRYAFETNDDTNEIAFDIETRVAEILYEANEGGTRIITLEMVSNVIERIGQPAEIMEIDTSIKIEEGKDKEEEEAAREKHAGINPPPYNPSETAKNYSRNPFVRKKMFRDPQNSMLGGVCSGLAAYLGIDPTWVRLLTVLLFFLSGTTVAIIYIILWIVLPEARTPYQRMQMLGENPTVENIGKTVTENFHDGEDKSSYNVNENSSGSLLSNIFSVFVKCLVILCLIIASPLLLAFIPILIICIIGFFASGDALAGSGLFGEPFSLAAPNGGLWPFYLLLAAIGGIITVGVPVFLLARMIFKRRDSNMSPNNRRSLLILWLIGIALAAVFTVKTVKMTKYLQAGSKSLQIENIEERNIDIDDIENINVNHDGVTVYGKDGKTIIIDKNGVRTEKINIDETEVVIDSLKVDTLQNDTVLKVH